MGLQVHELFVEHLKKSKVNVIGAFILANDVNRLQVCCIYIYICMYGSCVTYLVVVLLFYRIARKCAISLLRVFGPPCDEVPLNSAVVLPCSTM